MSRLLLFVALVLLLIVGWLFAAANSQMVTLNYLFGETESRLAFWLLGVFLAGFLMGALYCGGALLRARLAARRLRERCTAQEQEIQRLTSQHARLPQA